MELFSKIYEKRLENVIKKEYKSLPKHIVLIITESDLLESGSSQRIIEIIRWCQEYNIHILTIYISLIDLDPAITDKVYDELKLQITSALEDVDASIDLFSINGEKLNINKKKNSRIQINISIGYSGKKELTRAFKNIMIKIESGELKPDNIDESVIEKHLLIKYEPDLVVRSGGKHLADFLIWQSVYSEIYFTDMSWINFRKVDFLRAIRDFQKRQRRFGK